MTPDALRKMCGGQPLAADYGIKKSYLNADPAHRHKPAGANAVSSAALWILLR